MELIVGKPKKTLQTIFAGPGMKEKKVTIIFKDGLTDFIRSIIFNKPELKEIFYVLDLGHVVSLMETWLQHLPNISPFYAVKSNPEPSFLTAMAALGANFDCASQAEIEAVLSLGVSTDRILFANTCKPKSHIEYSASVGVNLATFDSKEEIEKIKIYHPKCGLLIRIKADDDCDAKYPLGSKFGALPNEIESLLLAAQAAGVTVCGVSFHIGSAATNPSAYGPAIAMARGVFDIAARLGMAQMHVLDIGGGFTDTAMFEKATITIKTAIQKYFPDESKLTVIAEPGRFFSEPAFTLAAIITGKRLRGELREYWINDGTHGSMYFNLSTTSTFNPTPFACASNSANPTCVGVKTHKSRVFGPTCDSEDVVVKEQQLPELEVDDWLLFKNMGAYKASIGSNFNGFCTSSIPTVLVYSIDNQASKL